MTPCKPEEYGIGGQRIFSFDPLADRRWEAMAEDHPQATVFHSAHWLRTLRDAYRFRPMAWSTSEPGRPLEDGLAACLVESRWTGRRLVSLPFSDHCVPLAEAPGPRSLLLAQLERSAAQSRLKYAEIRLSSGQTSHHTHGSAPPSDPSSSYCWHYLDLSPGAEVLYQRLHPSCVRAKVRRAQREGLQMRTGGEELLDDFYRLLVETRRRHGLPPQPRRWFRLLARNMGSRLSVRLALYREEPVAALLLLRHGSKLVYKYGCSQADRHALGSMPFLFWETIQEACAQGLTLFDLGRSDWDQKGLLDFKDRLGARRGRIERRVWPPHAHSAQPSSGGLSAAAQRLFAYLPDPLLVWAGRLLYPHIG